MEVLLGSLGYKRMVCRPIPKSGTGTRGIAVYFRNGLFRIGILFNALPPR